MRYYRWWWWGLDSNTLWGSIASFQSLAYWLSSWAAHNFSTFPSETTSICWYASNDSQSPPIHPTHTSQCQSPTHSSDSDPPTEASVSTRCNPNDRVSGLAFREDVWDICWCSCSWTTRRRCLFPVLRCLRGIWTCSPPVRRILRKIGSGWCWRCCSSSQAWDAAWDCWSWYQQKAHACVAPSGSPSISYPPHVFHR